MRRKFLLEAACAGEHPDDQWSRADFESYPSLRPSFARSDAIDARHIHVQAADGKVVLRGHVRSLSERDQAQHAAWSARGVCDVENQIEVFP